MLIALWANVWVRRIVAALVIIIVLAIAFLFMRSHFINEGKQQGVAIQTQRSADAIEVTHVADRSDAVQQLAVMQKQIDSLGQQSQTFANLVLSLAAQRAAVPAKVSGMTPDQVQAQINASLGKSSTSPLNFTDQDNRKIAACFGDLQLCNQQVDAQSKGSAVSAEQLADEQAKYQVLARYATTLDGLYTQLYNDTSTPRRSWKCLKLWHCDLPQISTPDPTKLLRPGEVKK